VCDNNAVGFHEPRRRDKWVCCCVSSGWCARPLKRSFVHWSQTVYIAWSMLPAFMCSEGGIEKSISCSTRALWLLLVTPLTISHFVTPPRTSFPMVKFHFGFMLGTPAFLLYVFLGLLDHRKPLEQRF